MKGMKLVYQVELPMVENGDNSAELRWIKKNVIESYVVCNMENKSSWCHLGQGRMEFSNTRKLFAGQSLCLISPTSSNKSHQSEPGRPHGRCAARLTLDGIDWRPYNRLSFWVYPELPGFAVISLSVILHNDGATKVPDEYAREGIHYFLLRPDEWNHVVWEIPHLARDRVTGLEFVYRLQGSDAGATKSVRFYIDQIEIERVDPDHYEGWDVRSHCVSFSHTGYQTNGQKVALVLSGLAEHFELFDNETNEVSYHAPIRTQTTAIGSFDVLDFSNFRNPGEYRIKIGSIETRPFSIRDRVWHDTVWKTINLFYCERCGIDIPGIHANCHRDWLVEHGDKQIVINGGWHDAGDVSQGLVNTAEAVHAMFRLAERLKDAEPDLSARLKEEAQWGLDWVLKTRFGDGYRVTWATMDLWTDGIIGTEDDEIAPAQNSAYANFVATAAEAVAAGSLRVMHPRLSNTCLQIAKEDYQFAISHVQEWNLDLASGRLLAALELFHASADTQYLDAAVESARYVAACQQRQVPNWEIPLYGYFYTTSKHVKIQHYAHVGHEHVPTVALIDLCETLPDHEDWILWYTTIALHTDYLAKTSKFTAPYHMITAGIYHEAESDEATHADQVKSGISLGDGYYLRRFPVWYAFRGNSGTTLSQAKALSRASRFRNNRELYHLSHLQLEWSVGRNPFSQSLMYGEGYDYAPQYSAMSGNIVGSLPVGIETSGRNDAPYWPVQNCYNYKEVWVHPSSRWLSLMEDLYFPWDIDQDSRSNFSVGRVGESYVFSYTGQCSLGQRFQFRTFNLTVHHESSNECSANHEWVTTVLDPDLAWVVVLELLSPENEVVARWDKSGSQNACNNSL